jgi:crossover junction endodeoxyribonuclease RuvC
MIVAGIDIGIKIGIAIVNSTSQKILHLQKIDTSQLTISELFNFLNNLIKSKNTKYIGYEKPIYHTNIKSMQKYIEKIGTVKLIASMNKIPIIELAPNAVKKTITGFGKASKYQVKELLRNVHGIKTDAGYDLSDAIAIAFAVVNKIQSNLLSNTKSMFNKNY